VKVDTNFLEGYKGEGDARGVARGVADILSRWKAVPSLHPCLLPEAVDERTWARLREDPFGRERLRALFAEADDALRDAQLIPELPFSTFIRFYRDGDRLEYEDLYFERRRKLQLFGLAALASPGPDGDCYVRALEDILWAICGEYSWCLPAHIHQPPCSTRPNEPPPADRFVDLFSAETAFALAELRGLLGVRLAPEVAYRVGREVRVRTIDGLLAGGYRYDWESARHNWAAVCSGGVGGAALWLLDDPSELAKLFDRLGSPFDSYLAGFATDGSCLEGMGYWTYGFGYFVAFAELLRELSSGAVDLLRAPSLKDKLGEIARFPQRSRLVGEAALGFSDASSPFRYPLGTMCRLASRLPGTLLPDFRLSEELAYDHCRRWASAVRDFVWFDPEAPSLEAAELGRFATTWFPDAQWAIGRVPTLEPPVAFAVKGGHNDEPHNHNDIGSFVLVAGDEAFLDDFGAGRYDRGYFGSGRYEYFVTSSFGHSVPIVDALGQRAGKEYMCRSARFESRPLGLAGAFELAGAYGIAGLESLERRLDFDVSREVLLRLEDEYCFALSGRREIKERFVSLLPARMDGEGGVSIVGKGGALRLLASARPSLVDISERSFEAHRGPPKVATVVDFVYEADEEAFVLAFECRLLMERA
jgi:hypothetical protein